MVKSRDAPISVSCCRRRLFSVLTIDCSINLLQQFRLVLIALSVVTITIHGIFKKRFEIGQNLQFFKIKFDLFCIHFLIFK